MENAFIIDVRRKKELIATIIDRVQGEAKISFEGNFKHIKLKITPSDKQTSVIRRNTSNYFWVFDINEETKDYLKREILNTIGLNDKVYHIYVQEGDNLIFESVDNFSEDCVILHKKDWVNKSFVESLKAKGIIWRYEVKTFE